MVPMARPVRHILLRTHISLFTRFVLEGKRDYLMTCDHEDEAQKITVDSPVPFDITKLIEKLESR